MANVRDIVDLYNALEKRDSARNSSYDEVLEFYGGKSYRDTRKQGFLSGISQALSSIFSPKPQDEDAQLRTPINLVKPAIENKVAFLALQPTVRVIEPPDQLAPGAAGAVPTSAPGVMTPDATGLPAAPGAMPPGPPAAPMASGATQNPQNAVSSEDWGTTLADRLEAVIDSLLAFSNMPKRSRDVAWSMSAMDGAIIGVWPDFRHNLPRVFTRTPQDFYPVCYDPDGLELSKAVWKETISGQEVFSRWGNKNYLDKDDVEVIQCIDEESFYTVLDQREWAHPPVENKMGLVPIVCVGNLGLPGMVFGSTNFKDAIPVAKQINYHMYQIDELSAAIIHPTIAIKDPLSVPDNIAIGQGGTITMGPQGSVELLGPMSLPNAFWQLGATLEKWFDIISDNPAILRSDTGGGLTTGKGFNAQLGPIAARMQTQLEILMSGWRQVIKYMILMWANFPGATGPVKAGGIKMKSSFYIDATPEEFMVDGEIWTQIEVFLDPQAYMDRQGAAVEIMQLYQNELIDWDTATNGLALVTNRTRTRKNIDKDRVWKAEGLAIANQAANSPMTANPNMADQQMTNYGLERGMVGEAGPPGQPEGDIAAGVPPEGAPPEMGGPVEPEEDVVTVLKEFFSSIQKLKGEVYIGGDVVLRPASLENDNWKVTVWVTVPDDKGTITRASEKFPEVYGHMTFITGRPAPDENAIQVAGAEGPPPGGPSAPPTGLGDEMPPPAEGAAPEEGMPPDLLSMIGG